MTPEDRKEWLWMLLLTLVLCLGFVSIGVKPASSTESFDDRLCVSMEEIAMTVEQFNSEGRTTSVEHIGEGGLAVTINHVTTLWLPHPSGAPVWCMQEASSGTNT